MKSIFSIHRRPPKDALPLTYEESLRFDLQLAKCELDNAYAGFDYATDPDLIDCYIYELNAAMKRYKYLLDKYNSLRREVYDPAKEAAAAQEPALQPLMDV